MNERICQNPQCNQPIIQRISEHGSIWQRRKYCSVICANRVNTRKPRPGWGVKAADRLEDIRWLLNSGESVESIAERLNVKPASMARWLRRHGDDDLARMFARRAA